jgi:glutamine---fructose-6-phosphate transaminase (isomerizing)
LATTGQEKITRKNIMCGIVGAIAQRNVVPFLLEGLQRLEYRGYDSAGIAILNAKQKLDSIRAEGKVSKLSAVIAQNPISGNIGIAHTRWATHGKPCEINAHPHISEETVAVVHNGIIENYLELREELVRDGYSFASETDSETIAHLIHKYFLQTNDFLKAVQIAAQKLTGAFALAIISSKEPNRIIGVRYGSPLVVGFGNKEYFLASDYLALASIAQHFIYLEEGDIADVSSKGAVIYDINGKKVERKMRTSDTSYSAVDLGHYRHFMQKEIFEQPQAINNTLEGCLGANNILPNVFGISAEEVFSKIERVQIAACGTSYHAGLIARHWLEELAGIPCQIEIASEIRYRKTVVQPNTLFVTISQSGETADTLAALRQAKKQGYLSSLAICNVPESSLARESDLVFLTKAGAEVGVASTKAFTTQLTALLMLTLAIGKHHNLTTENHADIVSQLRNLPSLIEHILSLDEGISAIAKTIITKHHALFLGRGLLYPIAMEGALKLKEISYIHAESYPAGELKHGPLALIDENMPVIVVAPQNKLFDKMISNIQEVSARGGNLIVFSDQEITINNKAQTLNFKMPKTSEVIAPIVYTIPLQLLAYHVAVLKGTDVDRPRNLAKSVTVE